MIVHELNDIFLLCADYDMNINSEDDLNPKGYDKDHIWLFNSAGTFSGNVKYLFLYCWFFRKDIYACYISGEQRNVDLIREMGFRAVTFTSPEGKNLQRRAGVYVNEQCKEHYPSELFNVKLLNLFHGVGLKNIERKWDREFLGQQIAKKYIQYNHIYRNNMCFLTTSEMMEKHFKSQLDLYDNQVIRAGYPRNVVAKKLKDANVVLPKELQAISLKNRYNSKNVIVYVPTYREDNPQNLLYKALPDLNRVDQILSKSNSVLLIKLHPKISRDYLFTKISSNSYQNIKAWDSSIDIYDYFDQIDVVVYDYSSIFYDFVGGGVKHFIRYVFDYDVERKNLVQDRDYFEYTCGDVARNFDDLCNAFDNINSVKGKEILSERDKIEQFFWSYSKKDDCEEIINSTLQFVPVQRDYDNFYSYDIFDTVIHRKCGNPAAIFLAVQESLNKYIASEPDKYKFSIDFTNYYVAVRTRAEANQREYVKKCIGDYEISFDDIFARMAQLYNLSSEEIELLKKLELSAELDNCYCDAEIYEEIKSLIDADQKVVFISDMYLPLSFIKSMLHKCSPLFDSIPVYLSSDRHVQKITGLLYLDVYRDNQPWIYDKWIHKGDNKNSDAVCAQKFGITALQRLYPAFNKFESDLCSYLNSFDGYKIATLFRNRRYSTNLDDKSYFAYSIASLIFVPYLLWVVRDAIAKGLKTLYFVSRDGLLLKDIADHIISICHLNIKTKLLYGSRKAWRLPSQVNDLDEEFFSPFGSFTGVNTSAKFYDTIGTNEWEFKKIFPEIIVPEKIDNNEKEALVNYLKNSMKCRAFILEKAKNKRENVIKYLKQEIDFSEEHAYVEFWARGYTQDCFTKLLDCCIPGVITKYYYYRTIDNSNERNIRFNYSDENSNMLSVEAIFANAPITTTLGYKIKDETIVPDYRSQQFDADLYWKISNISESFIKDLMLIEDSVCAESLRRASGFAILWMNSNPASPYVYKSLAHLKYATSLYGDLCEYAPALTAALCKQILVLQSANKSIAQITKNLQMSYARSSSAIKTAYTITAGKLVSVAGNDAATDKQSAYQAMLLEKLSTDPVLYCKDSKHYVLRMLAPVMSKSAIVRYLVQKIIYQILNRT